MNYIIPIRVRELKLSPWGKYGYVDFLGKGVRVVYSDPSFELTPKNINGYLFAIVDQERAYIEADSPNEAIEKFYKEYEEATSCGLESQAVEISRRQPIEELPSCPFMKYNKNGNTVCIHGDEEEFAEMENDPDENVVYGCGCVLDFADYGPKQCPIENTWKMFTYDYVIEEHKGFKFKRLNSVCLTPEEVAVKYIDILKTESAVKYGAAIAKKFHKMRKQFHKLDKIFKEFKLSWPQ